MECKIKKLIFYLKCYIFLEFPGDWNTYLYVACSHLIYRDLSIYSMIFTPIASKSGIARGK